MDMIRPNRVKQKLAAGQKVVSMAGLDTSDRIDLLDARRARCGVAQGRARAGRLRSHPRPHARLRSLGFTSIVRVNVLAYGPIYRTLDLGAQGVYVPHIDTADDARRFARPPS